jgi:hypothetical protein
MGIINIGPKSFNVRRVIDIHIVVGISISGIA